jgi:hypothetical protein
VPVLGDGGRSGEVRLDHLNKPRLVGCEAVPVEEPSPRKATTTGSPVRAAPSARTTLAARIAPTSNRRGPSCTHVSSPENRFRPGLPIRFFRPRPCRRRRADQTGRRRADYTPGCRQPRASRSDSAQLHARAGGSAAASVGGDAHEGRAGLDDRVAASRYCTRSIAGSGCSPRYSTHALLTHGAWTPRLGR